MALDGPDGCACDDERYGGRAVLSWAQWKNKGFCQVPDQRQFCQRKYCYEYRLYYQQDLYRQEAGRILQGIRVVLKAMYVERMNGLSVAQEPASEIP